MHSESNRITPDYSSFLDFTRWLAAFLVFAQHLRNPILIGYPDLPADERTMPVTIFYFLTGLGGSSVVVFFVLSGFLVGGIGLAKLDAGRFSPGGYAIDRATRLFIAYWPALLLTWLLDSAGQFWFGRTGLWDCGQVLMCRNFYPGFVGQLNAPTLAINLAMLQSFYGSYLGSNKPLWSLSYEFWFYAVFGIAALAIAAGGGKRIGWIGAAVGITALLGPRFVLLGGLWIIGLLVARYRGAHPRQFWPALAAFAISTLAMRKAGLEAGWQAFDLIAIYANGLAFAWLMIAARGRRLAFFGWSRRLNAALADFSYTLYLLHFPLFLFILGAFVTGSGLSGFHQGYLPSSGTGAMLYGGLVVVVPLLCCAVARVTEGQTDRVRRRLKCRLLGGQ
jgi:peptidoglycan/LPS O-acetylase OafA/YrhL